MVVTHARFHPFEGRVVVTIRAKREGLGADLA